MSFIDSFLQDAFQARSRQSGRQSKRPLVSLCYAQSLDGSLTTKRGRPTALSGPESSRLTHRLRAAHDAILVGVGTVLADQPRLNVRLVSGENPQPIILDGRLRTPPDAFLVRRHPRPAWIATGQNEDTARSLALRRAGARLLILPKDQSGRVQLPALLDRLQAEGIKSLMVEGGAQVIASFLANGLADLLVLTIAPLFLGGLQIGQDNLPLIGGSGALFPRLKDPAHQRLGEDLIVWGKIVYGG
jgi:riboflavin-specific deaminase-like protein